MTTPDYGLGMACTDELRTGRYVTGARQLAEANYRRITTTRGTLYGGTPEQNYGINLPNMIGSLESAGSASALPGLIENELLKDERNETVSAKVTRSGSGPGYTYTIEIVCDGAAGPFELTIAASSVTASLLGITEPTT